jgi:hypothetical protein
MRIIRRRCFREMGGSDILIAEFEFGNYNNTRGMGFLVVVRMGWFGFGNYNNARGMGLR